MSVSPERIEEALARAETDRNEYGQAYWHSDAVVLAAALREAQARLEWYDDHKSRDGSYDGELFGDLSSVSPPADEANR